MALKCFEGTDVSIRFILIRAKMEYLSRVKARYKYSIGMCHAIGQSIFEIMAKTPDEAIKIRKEIELFDINIAVKQFNANYNGYYWWEKSNTKVRIEYFDWLIEQYSKEI